MDNLKAGDYYLGQNIRNVSGLTELTDQEYAAYELVGIARSHPNERIYKGINSQFANFADWAVLLSALSGIINKISLQAHDSNVMIVRRAKKDTVAYINSVIGKYKKHTNMFNTYIWDEETFRVVLAVVKQSKDISLTVTLISK